MTRPDATEAAFSHGRNLIPLDEQREPLSTSELLLAELCGTNNLLQRLLTAVERLEARLGATSESKSSVEIAQSPKVGEPPRLTVKKYTDSPLQGDMAVEEYGRLFRQIEQSYMDGWQATVDGLTER